jgi:hypothetical protein
MMKQFFVALLLIVLPGLAFADNYKVESIGPLTETKVAEAVRGALEAKGLRVVDEKGKPVCEIWFSKNITPVKEEVAAANFGQIGEGAFVGVINFPSDNSDFRGQGIKAGYYTLRYGLILQDGNHLGVSPARDFLITCPIGDDKDPSVKLKADDVYKLSRSVSGTGHPSVWCMVAPDSQDGLPKIAKNEHEHIILEARIPTKSGDLAVGLIVVGKTEG